MNVIQKLEEWNSKNDLKPTKLERGPWISPKISFRGFLYSKLPELKIFHISTS